MKDLGTYKLRIEGIQCVLPSSGTAQAGTVHAIASLFGTGAGGVAGLILGGVITVGSGGTMAAPGMMAGGFVFVEIEAITQGLAAGGRALAEELGHTMPDQVYVHLDGKKIFPKDESARNMKPGDYAEIGVEVDRGSGNHRITIFEKDLILDDDLLYSFEIPPSEEYVRVAVVLDGESGAAQNPEGSIYVLWVSATRERNSREIINEAHKARLKAGEGAVVKVRPGLGFWEVAHAREIDNPNDTFDITDPPVYTDFIHRFGDAGWNGWPSRTISIEAVGDRVFCLGRGQHGVEIYEVMGGDWELRGVCERFGSDGWTNAKHYRTIQTAVAGGTLYLLGRGKNGVEIYAWNAENNYWSQNLGTCERFKSPSWDPAQYHETIQTVILKDKLYLLGRGGKGVDFYQWTGREWTDALDTCQRFKDPSWKNHESYWRTIRPVVTSSGLHLTGRGSSGVEVWTWKKNGWEGSPAICARFKDTGWKPSRHAETIQAVPYGDKIVVLGRGAKGVDAYVWDGTWSEPIESNAFGDGAGGKQETVWASITSTYFDGRIWMIGRSRDGAEIRTLDVDARKWTKTGTILTFSDTEHGKTAGVARTLGFVQSGGKLYAYGRVPGGQ